MTAGYVIREFDRLTRAHSGAERHIAAFVQAAAKPFEAGNRRLMQPANAAQAALNASRACGANKRSYPRRP